MTTLDDRREGGLCGPFVNDDDCRRCVQCESLTTLHCGLKPRETP